MLSNSKFLSSDILTEFRGRGDEIRVYPLSFEEYVSAFDGTPVKVYFVDSGLRNARLGFCQIEETHLMENIIYNELKKRGYSVDVGLVEIREMNDKGKKKQEERPLLSIGDSFKKIVVVGNHIKMKRDEAGITTAFFRKSKKLRHSLGRTSRSDFVQFQLVEPSVRKQH